MAPCFECGCPAEHEHHVVPRSLGGTRTVPLCLHCHGLVHGRALSASALTRAAAQARRARGERWGQIPYGYALGPDGRQLVPVPHEQATLARLAELRASGLSLRACCRQLERERHCTRTGPTWNVGHVHGLLAALSRTGQ